MGAGASSSQPTWAAGASTKQVQHAMVSTHAPPPPNASWLAWDACLGGQRKARRHPTREVRVLDAVPSHTRPELLRTGAQAQYEHEREREQVDRALTRARQVLASKGGATARRDADAASSTAASTPRTVLDGAPHPAFALPPPAQQRRYDENASSAGAPNNYNGYAFDSWGGAGMLGGATPEMGAMRLPAGFKLNPKARARASAAPRAGGGCRRRARPLRVRARVCNRPGPGLSECACARPAARRSSSWRSSARRAP